MHWVLRSKMQKKLEDVFILDTSSNFFLESGNEYCGKIYEIKKYQFFP